jgi:LysM repeat protein
LFALVTFGCRTLESAAPAPSPAPVPVAVAAPSPLAETETTTTSVTPGPLAEACSETASVASPFVDEAADAEIADAAEEEVVVPFDGDPNRLRYTQDIAEEALAHRWKNELASLGSISVGFAHEGRLINGVKLPEDPTGAYQLVVPWNAWATEETAQALIRVAQAVKARHPTALPLRINQISGAEGGYLRPHRSHQNGRDVDLGFYYPVSPPPRVREREKVIDVAQNWSLIRALITESDVQVILLDRRVQAVIYAHALASGEDPAWVDAIFRGPSPIVQHAPRHRDHLHVRFYNPRAQELGRRIAPLLAQRPEHNVVAVRIKNGDTLGHLAMRYGSSIRAIQKANRMRGTFLRIGQVVHVPLRGPCNRCPVPPPFEVPPRRLPPATAEVQLASPLSPVPTSTTSSATVGQTFSSLRR